MRATRVGQAEEAGAEEAEHQKAEARNHEKAESRNKQAPVEAFCRPRLRCLSENQYPGQRGAKDHAERTHVKPEDRGSEAEKGQKEPVEGRATAGFAFLG